ncbi:hypothetical protein [Solibacillus cecembensis]|uniref:hypothetical protein n=1 Tax=Solibacillus cecembensis TaxID=459347 RepID=UPI003D035E6F
MKRYWKMLLISIVSVIAIGFYYIQVAIAGKGDFPFKIETTSGNEMEIENISLEAYYVGGYFQSQLNISKDGSTLTQSNRSQMYNWLNPYIPDNVQNYMQEHRQFMRGKQYNEDSYFKDENYLVYAAIQDFDQLHQGDSLTMEIDLLDLKTDVRSSFEIQVPVEESYYWMGVRDVYMQDGKIKIVATGSHVNGGDTLRIFTVDEKSKALQEDKLIGKVASEVGISTGLHMHTNTNESLNDNYYLYEIKKYKERWDGPTNELLSHQLYVYNKLKNEVEEIVIPSELKPKMTFLYGAQVFMPTYSANGIELNHYSIETQQWEEPLHYNYPITVNKEEDAPLVQLMDEKIYIVNRVAGEQLLYIGDLRTGESLYEGKITADQNDSLSSIKQLRISTVLKNN